MTVPRWRVWLAQRLATVADEVWALDNPIYAAAQRAARTVVDLTEWVADRLYVVVRWVDPEHAGRMTLTWKNTWPPVWGGTTQHECYRRMAVAAHQQFADMMSGLQPDEERKSGDVQ